MNYENHFWKPSITVFQQWQKPIVEYLYKDCYDYPIRSQEVHNYMKQVHPGVKISRASVINFLNGLHCAGYLECWTAKAKGGDHFKYRANMTLAQFKEKLLTELRASLDKSMVDVG